MILPTPLDELEKLYASTIDTIFATPGLPDNYTQLEEKLNRIVSDTTLERLYNPENRKDAPQPPRRRKQYVKLIPMLLALLPKKRELKARGKAEADATKTQSDKASIYAIFYWDGSVPSTIDGLNDHGAVVTGTLALPGGFANKGVATLTLSNQAFKGKIWVNEYEANHLDVSARFTSKGQPDLFMTIHISDKGKTNMLVGAFASADMRNHSPLHGAFYLLHRTDQPASVAEKLAEANLPETKQTTKVNPPATDPDLEQKIRLSLYRQTQVLKYSSLTSLPDYVYNSYNTLRKDFANRTFVGYFFNTLDLTLENFLLKVDSSGRVFIKYHNHNPDSGLYRLYHDDIVWFAFNYEPQWRLYRYRMNFRKVKINQIDWYLGLGSGSQKSGVALFMNRVAMVETNESWEKDSVIDPIALTNTDKTELNKLFVRYPVLKEYLSGVRSNDIPYNERLSETPALLEMAGLLNQQVSRSYDSIRGSYLLYSLSRIGGVKKEDEKFEIVKMPLYIGDDGKAELTGENRTYYGQASSERNRLALHFDQRLEAKGTKKIPAFITAFFKITTSKEKTADHLVGTSVRFISEMPEARTELLVKLDEGGTPEVYQAYTIFSESWLQLQASDNDITSYLSGRVNRMVLPQDTGLKKPTARQPFFRLLFAHAAKSQIGAAQPDLFIKYLYQAAHHSFAMEEKDERTLLTQLKANFDELMKNGTYDWATELKAKAAQIRTYLDFIDKTSVV